MSRLATAFVLVALAMLWLPVHAQPDPFVAMNALRVTPPSHAPDVAFRDLDGVPVRVSAFRGQAVLLTFFTTW